MDHRQDPVELIIDKEDMPQDVINPRNEMRDEDNELSVIQIGTNDTDPTTNEPEEYEGEFQEIVEYSDEFEDFEDEDEVTGPQIYEVSSATSASCRSTYSEQSTYYEGAGDNNYRPSSSRNHQQRPPNRYRTNQFEQQHYVQIQEVTPITESSHHEESLDVTTPQSIQPVNRNRQRQLSSTSSRRRELSDGTRSNACLIFHQHKLLSPTSEFYQGDYEEEYDEDEETQEYSRHKLVPVKMRSNVGLNACDQQRQFRIGQPKSRISYRMTQRRPTSGLYLHRLGVRPQADNQGLQMIEEEIEGEGEGDTLSRTRIKATQSTSKSKLVVQVQRKRFSNGGASTFVKKQNQLQSNNRLALQFKANNNKKEVRPNPSSLVQKIVTSTNNLQVKELTSRVKYLENVIKETRDENKTLKSVHHRQGVALRKYEGTEAELPKLLDQHKTEMHYLQCNLKKANEIRRDYEEKLRVLNQKLNRMHAKNLHLEQLVQQHNLDERHCLASQLQQVTNHADNVEMRLLDYERHVEVLEKNHVHQIEVEDAKLRTSNKKLFDARKEIKQLTEVIRQKDKILNYYRMRFGREMECEPPMMKKMNSEHAEHPSASLIEKNDHPKGSDKMGDRTTKQSSVVKAPRPDANRNPAPAQSNHQQKQTKITFKQQKKNRNACETETMPEPSVQQINEYSGESSNQWNMEMLSSVFNLQ